jgi:hypothetical protein
MMARIMVWRPTWMLLLALLEVACERSQPPAVVASTAPEVSVQSVDAALIRARDFLLAKQGQDGAIRSATYAAFKDGYSLTPLVILGLQLGPLDERSRMALGRAVDFSTTLLDDQGEIRKESVYPLYAAALTTLVLSSPGNQRHRATRDRLLTHLRRRQFSGDNAWAPDDTSFGGWGYFPGVPQKPVGENHNDLLTSNLSATLLAVGALTLSGVPLEDPALRAASEFVDRCQNFAPGCSGPQCDGGFFFSPALPDGNKAGMDPGGRPVSYGSMTADGVRAALRLGRLPQDARVLAAAAWLARHFDPAHNPGAFVVGSEVRQESSYYYWTWSVAHALRALGQPTLTTTSGDVAWAPALGKELLARQAADGSWKNSYSEMRENDPIVATAFAAAALTVIRASLAGEYRSHAGWAAPAR